jgi:hypothetical protein
MTVWVLILNAVITGSTLHIFVGTFDTQASCEKFVAVVQPKFSFPLTCEASEVKTYPER